jgi:RHS repeat-associated protein
VIRQITIGPALHTGTPESTPAQQLVVINYYNPAGLLDSLHRYSSPDPSNVDTIRTQWDYDAAMRPISETAPDRAVQHMAYDAAGNMITLTTRRGHGITMTYDALNRLTSRSVPTVTYHDTLAGIGIRDDQLYPRQPTSGSSYVIDGQTELYAYDAIGRIRMAYNADAHVRRTYYPYGALKSEEQQLRDANDAMFSHDFVLTYSYDLDGHRTAVHLPSAVVPAGTRDSISWAYSSLTGQLTDVTDPLGNTFHYEYSPRNEPVSLAYPGSYTERWGYDADGQITGDTIFNLGGTTGGRWLDSLARAMTMTYDARGKMLNSQDVTGFQQTTGSEYTGLGALATFSTRELAALPQADPDLTKMYATGERQRYDALGNIYAATTVDTTWIGTDGPKSVARTRTATYQPGVGRLLSESSTQGLKNYVYDSAGNLTFSTRDGSSQNTPLEDRFTYYGADGKVRAADARTVLNPNTRAASAEKWVFEKYRYDALGRRVWVRTYRECEDQADEGPRDFTFTDLEYKECSTSTLRRTVWDGDQELIEIQVPGDSLQPPSVLENDDYLPRLDFLSRGQSNDPNPLFGRVVYTHGIGLDHPIALTRYRYVNLGLTYTDFPPMTYSLFWSPLGQLTLAICADGMRRCDQNGLKMGIDYPEQLFAYDRPQFIPRIWQGTLILDKLDAAGTVFRRNRVYDPATGRFTQEDPIGLAGGLNLYGFADGDPVTFSDPFGLCSREKQDDCSVWDVFHNFLQGFNAALQGGSDTGPGWRTGVFAGFLAQAFATRAPVGTGTAAASADAVASGLGDLSAGEVKAIQQVVNRAGRPLNVVGSAARGARQAGSDIDYITGPSSIDYFKGLEKDLPSLDPQHGIIPGTPNPYLGPSIRFEPGAAPRIILGPEA